MYTKDKLKCECKYAEVQNITHILNSTCDGNSLYLGGRPCVNSSAVIPKLQMSAEESYCRRSITSGAIQQGCRTNSLWYVISRPVRNKFTYSTNKRFSLSYMRSGIRRSLAKGYSALCAITPQLRYRKKVGMRER